MIKIINDLYKLNRTLVGSEYDKALQYIKKILPEMKILEFPTGKTYETWTIPQKWEIKDAWVKFKGKKIIDFKKEPLSVIVGSEPINKKVQLKELADHLYYSLEKKGGVPYIFKYYDKDWGFCTSSKQFIKLEPGEYEVFIDSKYSDGTLKIGEYIIKGGKREILIIAHLDHPYQANDNLSGVAVAIDLAKKLKCKHTIKILFVPETIGSIVYALTQDLSKVDFEISLDVIGNDNTLLMQDSYFGADKINKAAVAAMGVSGHPYRRAPFRGIIGSDEYAFNDPEIGIPGILFTRFPYPEYHSSLDTPGIIKEDKLAETREVVKKTIEIMENDWTPIRNFKAPLMRSKYGIEKIIKQDNRKIDYLFYMMDGKRTVLDLAEATLLNFDETNKLLKNLKKDGLIKKNTIRSSKSNL